MNYFEGIDFFFLLFGILAVSLILGFLGEKQRSWITMTSIVFVVLIYSRNMNQLFLLIMYLIVQWINIKSYAVLRKKYKRNKFYYYSSLFIAILPLFLNKISGPLDMELYSFLGISYISFKTIQIVIEIYDGLIKKVEFRNFLPFMIFFPAMSSGPIDRYRRFSEDAQRYKPPREYADLLGNGIFRLILGYAYKFIISYILYEKLQLYAAGFEMADVLRYMYLYGFYLFFDFAGYSLMAVGASNIMGIQTPMNFNMPFISVDIKDFWNRWHISLSHWFRDFVFSRIVKNIMKKRVLKSMIAIAFLSYIINMFIMGAWHGLTASYLLYGLFHGVLLAVNDLYEKKFTFYEKIKDRLAYKILSWFVTFHLVMFSFLIFSGRFLEVVKHYI